MSDLNDQKVSMCSRDPEKCANNPYIVDCIIKALTNKLIESLATTNTDNFTIDDLKYTGDYIDISIGYPIDELIVLDIDGDVIITPNNAKKIGDMIGSFLNFFKKKTFSNFYGRS